MTTRRIAAVLLTAGLAATGALADDKKPDFDKVSEGYEKLVTGAESGMWNVWKRDKDAQLLAEIPKSAMGKWVQFVATVAGGDPQVGVYSIWHDSVGVPAKTVYWEQRGDKLALIEPNLDYRTTGDAESKSALERIYTDRVVLSVPIITTGLTGGHVIDLDQVLLANADEFFGSFTRQADRSLAQITGAKAFPNNIELTFELPRASGQLAEIHYSLGMPEKSPGFKPREADRRVGVYYVNYTDRSKHGLRGQVTRYANRWHIEKADSKLKMSPPKEPIVYYIEHTTPIRYRRWVRDGVLAWNKAFEQVGIVGAIEVRQQDQSTGAHMDIDPEDIRYSFVRWTNSSMGFAIGPVHVHPDTGEIYEADIVMDEGFLSSYANQYMQTELASAAMAAMHPELAPWLAQNPDWDPRVRLASPADRPAVQALARALVERPAMAGPALNEAPPTMRPEVWAQHQQAIGAGAWSCKVQPGLATSVAMARLSGELGLIPMEDASDEGSVLDGLPEQFVGPLLRDVVMHEVGHTLGMMHNWKGSAQYGFADINSTEFKGVKPILGTVMDYAPANIVVEDGELVQGDYAPIDIGPYDKWVIEWNYTFDDPAKVASRATEPGLGFNAEDGAFGPDPQAKVWDLGENSLDYADARMAWVRNARAKFLDVAVKDDDTWQRARSVYGQLLGAHFGTISIASNWVGGAYTNKFTKGDNGPDPVRPVEVDRQRRALAFIADNAFDDAAFGLDPAVLRKLGSDNWYDSGYATAHDWPVHDQILGVQASAMSMLINPTRLRRVQDNELRTPAGEDAVTVPEVLSTVREAVWASAGRDGASFTEREPLVSSLQRNLQKEHVERLIDLATGASWPGASRYDLQALARQELREVLETVSTLQRRTGIDRYTLAHAADLTNRIEKALEASYTRD
ncbi:MAG: zinc-dependent metalloprotease [Phycisphaerales bacterium]